MKTHLVLGAATELAMEIIGVLRPGCERIEVAGSVRRRQHTVGDIELVVIPAYHDGLFPGEVGESKLDPILEREVRAERLLQVKGGDRHRQYRVGACPDVYLDLFITDRESWGVNFTLRTGPAGFSAALVRRRCYGGLLPDELTVDQRRVWRGRVKDQQGKVLEPGVALDTPEEADFFRLCGLPHLAPERRRWPLQPSLVGVRR